MSLQQGRSLAWAAVSLISILLSANLASASLTVHTTEFGVAKFHRLDNKLHHYAANNVWAPVILPDDAATDKPLVRKNADGSYTVFYSTLEEMVTTISHLAQEQHDTVGILNVHGHGLPGAMWFPKDAKTLASIVCWDWKSAANGDDQGNYDQYYSPVSASEVQQIRDMSKADAPNMACTTGLREWTEIVNKHPEFKSSISADAQVSFLSCVVGLGKAGDNFTKGMAQLLLPPNSSGRVQTSTNFGLGDWSMPDGMGFWDYISDEQLNHDNEVYPKDKQDAEIKQKGTIRLAFNSQSQWVSGLISNQDVMIFDHKSPIQPDSFTLLNEEFSASTQPESVHMIRIPGTNAHTPARY